LHSFLPLTGFIISRSDGRSLQWLWSSTAKHYRPVDVTSWITTCHTGPTAREGDSIIIGEQTSKACSAYHALQSPRSDRATVKPIPLVEVGCSNLDEHPPSRPTHGKPSLTLGPLRIPYPAPQQRMVSILRCPTLGRTWFANEPILTPMNRSSLLTRL